METSEGAPGPARGAGGDASGERVVFELRPDARTALRYYVLLAVASTLGVAVCVILFAGATAGSLTLLLIQIAMMEVSFHVGLAGVFYDFYRRERGKRWRLTAGGIDMSREGGDARSVPWPEVARAYPKGSSVCLETGRDAEPHRLYFVSAADRDRFYRLYLLKTMFPFEDAAA